MASTDIIQPNNLTKQIHHQNSYSQLNKSPTTSKQQEQSSSTQNKCILNELDTIQKFRIRSLSHWAHIKPSSISMAAAGWFSCNVHDRVICIYCNTICHEWTSKDDPAEVHKRLAPHCPFVRSMPPTEHSPKIVNENLQEKLQPAHPDKAEISRRQATYSNIKWNENAPSIDDLVRAGFFFSGIENTVTCFYCNGSLHQWSSTDNPMIEHARWFPNCIYAKHLCGNDLYHKIQTSKKRLLNEKQIDKAELQRLVTARLDLPIVQRLRSKYSLAIIKRCIEDQLRIKNDDFISDMDLTMACLILQKQIEHIKGCKDNIITPSATQQTDSNSSETKSKQSLGECFICLTEEKQLACMPCGHLCACVPCGYSLRSCPICRENIQSFMRINS